MEKTYIFRYVTKAGKFLGYHMDSTCTIEMDFLNAKRYEGCKTPEMLEDQRATIDSNFRYLYTKYRNGIVKGEPIDSIVLEPEELAEHIAARGNKTNYTFVLLN